MQTRREQDFVCVEVSETGENTLVGEDFDDESDDPDEWDEEDEDWG